MRPKLTPVGGSGKMPDDEIRPGSAKPRIVVFINVEHLHLAGCTVRNKIIALVAARKRLFKKTS
jgi:hypothetical protein